MEPDQIDVFTATMFRDLEKVVDIFETRSSRQVRGDVGHADRANRIHFDLAFIHGVATANFDVGILPDPDTAGDGASTHAFPEPLRKHHAESLRPDARFLHLMPFVASRR